MFAVREWETIIANKQKGRLEWETNEPHFRDLVKNQITWVILIEKIKISLRNNKIIICKVIWNKRNE